MTAPYASLMALLNVSLLAGVFLRLGSISERLKALERRDHERFIISR